MSTTAPARPAQARRYRDTPIDVKLVLSALWIAMLFIFAYVDIFTFYRADVLDAALDGKVATTTFSVNQAFLTGVVLYILVPSLMIVLSLLLPPRTNRIVNIVVGATYLLTVAVSCIGVTWVYYLLGSGVEVLLLAGIVRAAWTWPAQ